MNIKTSCGNLNFIFLCVVTNFPIFFSVMYNGELIGLFFSRGVHDRYVRNFGGKLSNLYTLLCYIYHLRTRDLRTRVSGDNTLAVSFMAIDVWKDLPSSLKDLSVFAFPKYIKRYLLSEQKLN